MTVDLGQWDTFKADLEKLIETEQAAVIRIAAETAGVKLDEIVRNELPPEPRKKSVAQHWTPRQVRWWWATMAKKAQGQSRALPGWKAAYRTVDNKKTLVISGAHKRTGTLVKSLTYQVDQQGRNTTLRYGTNNQAARYTIDKENQSRYHKGNWKTLQDLVEKNMDAVQGAFADRLTKEAKERLNA